MMSSLTLPIQHPFVKAISRGGSLGNTASYLKNVAENETQYEMAQISYCQFKTFGYTQPSRAKWWMNKFTYPIVFWKDLGCEVPYYLVKACLIGTFSGTSRTDFYRAACGLQKAKGHFLGVFSDPWGQYHLSSADFHERCYDIMDASQPTKSAKKTKIVRSIGLTNQELKSISPKQIPETVEQLDSERMVNLTFSTEQLQAIPLEKLSEHQISGLFPTFNAFDSTSKSGPRKLVWKTCEKPEEERKRQKAFQRLEACNLSDLEAIKDRLAPEHKVYLVHKIIKTKGFDSALIEAFGADIIFQALCNLKHEELVAILEAMSPTKLSTLLPYLSVSVILKISPEKFQALDLNLLTNSQVAAIFDTTRVSSHQAMIDQMTALQISTVLPKLTPLQIKVFSFSNVQLQELDLETLPKNLLDSLLPQYEVSKTLSVPMDLSKLSNQQKIELEVQSSLAKKVLSVFSRLEAFLKATQKNALQKRLPDLWTLYQAWKDCGSDITPLSPILQIQKAMKNVPEPPPHVASDKGTTDLIPTTLIGKVYYYAVAFFTHVWNGLCFATRVVTYPVWKPYTIAKDYFTAKGSVEA